MSEGRKGNMDLQNPLYKKQGIHVDIVVFTVDGKDVKTLLVKRSKKPFVGEWIIPGGAVYNNESIDYAAKRELKEKTGLNNLFLEQFYAFGEPKRDPRQRMVSVAYLALINKNKVNIQQKTPKTMDAGWFSIEEIPDLAFDHNKIVLKALEVLKKKLMDTNIAFEIMPAEFTLAELHFLYETILNKQIDRRNFRRKLLSIGLIESTGEKEEGVSNRPGVLYRFKERKFKEIEII